MHCASLAPCPAHILLHKNKQRRAHWFPDGGDVYKRQGLGIAWFSMFCRTWNSRSGGEISFLSRLGQSVWTFDHIRILGVMQRLALCYGATAIIALTMKHKYIPYLIVTLLVGYFILLLTGNGFEYNDTNIPVSYTHLIDNGQ